jgi:serralysin
MATPTSNSAPVSLVAATLNYRVDALLDGEKWGGGMDTGVTLSYSFPGIGSSWVPGYASGEPKSVAFAPLTDAQIAAFQSALATWSAVTNVQFVQVPDTVTQVGDIRIAWSALGNAQAYAYMPSQDPSGGDVWLNTLAPWDGFSPGDYGYLALLHELGHTLGLKHPFEGGGVNNTMLPVGEDYDANSLMSYYAYPGDMNAIVDFYPTTPMLDDILAIQRLYGANMSYHSGDDTYVFDQSSHYYETVWDAGGNDAIQYNSTMSGLIDLRAGHFSHLGQPIEVTLGNGTMKAQANTVAIAYGVTIENAAGGSGNDIIYGNSADNHIDGGAGADKMIGGPGNDTYVVDSVGDRVVELPAQGLDAVLTSLNRYTLPVNVEDLKFMGSGDFTGHGDALNNVIQGGAGNDYLDGSGGVDTLIGGTGNDTYVVDNSSDHVHEEANEDTDTVLAKSLKYVLPDNVENLHYTGTGNFTGIGNSADNIIVGGAGNDTLDGGTGDDQMIGRTGNDAYFVDSVNDTVIEGAGTAGGLDKINTTLAAFDLSVKGANVEKLAYIGTSDFSGTGNQLANIIGGGMGNDTLNGLAGADALNGGAGNDTLDGGMGADKMIGGAGNDTYVVDNVGDVVTEGLNAGTDTVQGSISFTLGANVENLTLTGMGNINGTGNALGNTLIGNAANNVLQGGAGADTLDGGAGNDLLRGGLGNDTFIFDAADTTQVAGGTGVDTLKFTGSGQALDLAGKAGTVYTGLEAIDFTGTGDALSFSAADVVKLSATTNDLFINGIAGDSITSTGQGWVAGADETIGGILYHSYTSGAAHLHAQADMTAMLS